MLLIILNELLYSNFNWREYDYYYLLFFYLFDLLGEPHQRHL